LQAKICVQQALLLRKCSRLTKDGRRVFFSELRSNDKKVLGAFWDDVNTTIDAVRKKAVQIETLASSKPPLERSRRDNDDDAPLISIRKMRLETPKLEIARTFGVRATAEDDPTQFDEARPGPRMRRSAIEEDSAPEALSINPDIRGTEEDRESLDLGYSKRLDAKRFFVVGRVFALLWHEGAGEGKPDKAFSTPVGRHGQRAFSHTRRMVVVRERWGYCVCIPINTYGGQGVMKHGLSTAERQAHSIIHANDTAPYAEEGERGFLVKKPIAVKMASKEQRFDKMSRINFGKPSSVEWNVKVLHIGRVAPESMAVLLGYYINESNR
jgi:Cdc37 Hsp90 binding domain